jgi:hypothetical protein
MPMFGIAPSNIAVLDMLTIQVPMPVSGTLSNFRVRHDGLVTVSLGPTTTYTVLLNGGPTAMSCTINLPLVSAGAEVCSSCAEISFAAGDTIVIRVDLDVGLIALNLGVGSATWSALFVPD